MSISGSYCAAAKFAACPRAREERSRQLKLPSLRSAGRL